MRSSPKLPPPAPPPSAGTPQAYTEQSRRLAREILKRSRSAARAGRRSTWKSLAWLAAFQGLVMSIYWLVFRRRGGRKDIKTI